MASKSNKMNGTVYILDLIGLFGGALISLYFHGLEKNYGEGYFGVNLVESILSSINDVYITLGNNIHYEFITLAIKFLHFFVAKSLKFRYLSYVQPAASATSILFWVAFTRAVSSMSDNLL